MPNADFATRCRRHPSGRRQRRGKYHGKWGFEAFTNTRGVMYHSAKNDPGLRYPPYSQHTSERKIESRLTP